jgi:hypothetical protein
MKNTELKHLVKENLEKVKKEKNSKLLSENKIIKNRYSILVQGKKLKTKSDFIKLSDLIT